MRRSKRRGPAAGWNRPYLTKGRNPIKRLIPIPQARGPAFCLEEPSLADLQNEIERRRTFAIISHPDAGKTTLTEKFLLYGGAINLAGAVKGKKAARHAVSDWMEIEKQRGISVTSSVMQFNYEDYCINILDTPGHQDFSEDTYRTLMAADSAVMVIDASKGVENQTRKLFKVCLLRDIPIFTFINKMDREARNPFDLLEQIEAELGIKTYPMNWPIGAGKEFQGVYDRGKNRIIAFTANGNARQADAVELGLGDEGLKELLGEQHYATLTEDIELLDGAGYEFDLDLVRHGKLSPVFFGSALTNFGVEPFLEEFLHMTTPPLPRKADAGEVNPFDKEFSGFVFKIQANMNKAHRDRIAFMRICSGRFEKGMEVQHIQGGKRIKLSQPQQLMAQDREIIEEAYAGDIIGVFDPGIFSIGDTLCAPGKKFQFEGIPTFAPEHFSLVRQVDTMKRKQFVKGITQIAQEGAIQIFQEPSAGMEEVIVGVVGTLQFDVLQYRLKNEYNVEIRMEGLPYSDIRWIENEDLDPKTLSLSSDTKRVQDLKGNRLLLFANTWSIQWALDHNPGLRLADFSRS
jgi:peptide chain release factor 3